jgi:hypothetical protein
LILLLAMVSLNTACAYAWHSYDGSTFANASPSDQFRIATDSATYQVHAVRVLNDSVSGLREYVIRDTLVRIALTDVRHVEKWETDAERTAIVTGTFVLGVAGVVFIVSLAKGFEKAVHSL